MFSFLSARKTNRTAILSPVTALLGGIGFAFMAATVQAQDAPKQEAPKPEPTYSVQRTYKAGETDRYKINATHTINNAQTNNTDLALVLTMLMRESVSSVTPEGSVTVEQAYEEASVDVNGNATDLIGRLPKLIMTTDKSGHREIKAEGGDANISDQMVAMYKQMGAVETLVLPTRPVKVGESWNPDVSKMDSESGAKTTLTVKLEAVETLHGVKALKLKSVMDSVGGADPNTRLHVEATVEVDAQTGKPIKMISKTEGSILGGKLSSDTVMERVEPDAKKETAPASGDKKDPTAKPDPGAKKDTGDKKP